MKKRNHKKRHGVNRERSRSKSKHARLTHERQRARDAKAREIKNKTAAFFSGLAPDRPSPEWLASR